MELLPRHAVPCLWEEGSLADAVSLFQGELLSPCRCDGSVKCTHQPCLIKWISERGCWSCELCYYKYHVIAISTKNPLQVKVLETFQSLFILVSIFCFWEQVDFTCLGFPSLHTVIHRSETLRKGFGGLVQRGPMFCSVVLGASLGSLLFLSFDNSHIHLPPVENASVTTIVL